jgi:hypothetical protein
VGRRAWRRCHSNREWESPVGSVRVRIHFVVDLLGLQKMSSEEGSFLQFWDSSWSEFQDTRASGKAE